MSTMRLVTLAVAPPFITTAPRKCPPGGSTAMMILPLPFRVKPGGTHGELPDVPDLRAAFFVVGPGVPAGKDLGLIDMRDIAPSLAKPAGLSLPSADGKALLP